MATVQDIVESAFSKIKIRAVGQTMSAADLAHGLQAFIDMIEAWALEDLTIYSNSKENFPLVVGDADYSIGSSGNFNTVRPQVILPNTFIRDSSGSDHPVIPITMKKYAEISDKSLTGRPYQIAYNPTFPLGMIYLFYTPDSVESIYLESLKTIGTYTTLNDTITLPPGYKIALVCNLGIHLSPDYGKKVSDELGSLAKSTKYNIKRRNIVVGPTKLEVGRLTNSRLSNNILNLEP